MAGDRELKVNRTKTGYAAAVAATLVLLTGLWACMEGDDKEPGTVRDINYFFLADALMFSGQVSQGSTLGIPDTRILAWTAPGDDGSEGTAAAYDIRFFTAADLAAGGVSAATAFGSYWENARELFNEPMPRKAGRLEQLFLPMISPGESVWFALRTFDEIGQDSDLSNVVGPVMIQRLSIPVRPEAGATAGEFGSAMAGMGDVNQDGFLDMLVASPREGKVCLVPGAASNALVTRTPNINNIPVLSAIEQLLPVMTVAGSSADEFGRALAGLLLVNGDQVYDLAIGAPGLDYGTSADAGAVFIKYGGGSLPAAISANSVDVIITGEGAFDRFGEAVSMGLDLDGDGGREFVVGAPGAYGAGAVYVFKDSLPAAVSAADAFVVVTGEAAGDSFGSAVAGLGDVNGDGFPDFAVGAPWHDSGGADAGAVYVFYGGAEGVVGFSGLGPGGTVIDLGVSKADVSIRGTTAGRRFGRLIAPGGDLVGDVGLATDFAVCGGDSVYVFFGGEVGPVSFPLVGASVEADDTGAGTVLGSAPGEQFGAAVAAVGDLDRDGHSDLVVGAPGADKLYLFYGRFAFGGASRVEVIDAFVPGLGFGRAVAGTGDVNLDGHTDLLIGSPGAGEAYFTF